MVGNGWNKWSDSNTLYKSHVRIYIYILAFPFGHACMQTCRCPMSAKLKVLKTCVDVINTTLKTLFSINYTFIELVFDYFIYYSFIQMLFHLSASCTRSPPRVMIQFIFAMCVRACWRLCVAVVVCIVFIRPSGTKCYVWIVFNYE